MAKTSLNAQQIADLVAGECLGSGDAVVDEVASLDDSSAHSVSFLANEKYRSKVLPSSAAVVIVPADFTLEPQPGRAWIRCKNPSAAFSKVVVALIPAPPVPPAGVHSSAVVASTAILDPSVAVGPHAVIEDGVRIGARSIIEAGSYIGRDTVLGDDCRIWPNVTVRERCRLGNLVIIHSGTVVGSDGFGYEPGRAGHTKIPQLGIVQIDDDVEIGSNVSIDRARFGRTWIKRGAKIDNLVQIAHNVVIGEFCFIVSQVGIAGSSTLGKGVVLAGQAGVAGHVTIGDGAVILGRGGVQSDLAAGVKVAGNPAVPHREHFKDIAYTKRIPETIARVKALEAELAALKALIVGEAAAAGGTGDGAGAPDSAG